MGKRILVSSGMLTSWSLLIFFITLHNIFTEAAPQDQSKLLKFTNLRKCRTERFATGEKWAPCPSHRPLDPIDWPCIRAADLCNGSPDCPNGEDEEPSLCMFHSLYRESMNTLKRDFLRLSGVTPSSRTPSEFVKVKPESSQYLEFE